MDIVAKLTIVALITLATGTVSASVAGTEIANIQSWLNEGSQGYYKPGTGDQWVRNQADGQRYVKVESKIDYRANNGRTYPVVVEKTAQIDGSKIGKAAVKLAKAVTPLSIGFAVYDVVCELSNICKSENDDSWVIPGESIPSENSIWDCSGFGDMTVTECLQNIQGCNQGSIICDNPRLSSDSKSYLWDKKFTNGNFIGVITMTRLNPYELSQPRTPTEIDWTAAETQLNDPRFDEPLLVNGQPVPLANLPILGNVPPIPLSDEESVNRDSNGNITGTTRTITELHVSDGATSSRPGSVTGIEVSTKTDYNSEGQPTGTQTSTTTPPPGTTPPEPMTIEFDGVEGVQIETEEFEPEMPEGEVSWGEGVCPPDVPLPFHDLIIPMQPVCDAAGMLRPVVILLASLSALFIVAGLREARTA